MLTSTIVAATLLISAQGLGQASIKPGKQAQPTPQELADRFMDVSGGKDRYESLECRELTMKVSTSDGTPIGSLETCSNVAGQYLNTFTVTDGDTETSGSNGKITWTVHPNGKASLFPPSSGKILRWFNNPAWPLSISDAFNRIATTRKVAFGGEGCWRVLGVPAEGKPVELFFSSKSGRFRGYTLSLVDGKGITEDFKVTAKDYTEVDGFEVPSELELRAKTGVIVMKLESMKNNPEISEGTFDLPEAVQTLVSDRSTPPSTADGKGDAHARLISMIGSDVVTSSGNTVPSSVLSGKDNVLLYFSAKWCPPCRTFTPRLVKFFDDHSSSKDFTIVFVSSDKSSAEMGKYMQDYGMNFYAVPFDRVVASGIKTTFGDRGIPNLVWLDAEDKPIAKSYVNGNYVGPNKVLDQFGQSIGVN